VTEYEPHPHETLRQGDVILAPTALLVASIGEGPTAPPLAPQQLGLSVRGELWIGGGIAPASGYEAQWSPVLVLSHDCELEKEFNERVTQRIREGVPELDAIVRASEDPTLDPYAVVAPLLPYGAFDADGHEGIHAGQRIGCLPIDALPLDGGDYVVDLSRPCTVSVELLPQAAKIASLAQTSVFELRYKLSEAYASRDLAVLAELEALVGHRITAVEALPKSRNKTSLVLHLEDAEPIHIEIRRPREALPAELERLPRPHP
jgi:hypothetical protein